jgi:hypothetical protein
MKIEIKNRFNDNIIICGEYKSIKECLERNLRDADLRYADLRYADLCDADLRDVDLRDANLRGANLRGANLYDADLRYADLCDANLYGANLRGANLRGANLRGANLYGADLCDANLYGANLRGADLCNAFGVSLPIISINGSKHSLFYANGNLTIGCEWHHLEYWIIMYDIILKQNGYTEKQIEEYGKYIFMIYGIIK